MSYHEVGYKRSTRQGVKDLQRAIDKLKEYWGWLALALQLTAAAYASEGVLPKGRNQGPGVQYSIKKSQDIDPSCFSYHYNPEDGFFYFSEKADALYWIAKEKDTAKAGISQSYLIELQLPSMALRKVIGLKAGDDVELIGHGSPLMGVSLFDFSKSIHGCGQGYSVGLGVKWANKKQVLQTFPEEYYKLVPSDRGTKLADRSQHVIREFDLNSMQKVPPEALPKDGIPLFIDYHRNHIYTFVNQGHGILQRHEQQGGKVLAQLKLAENMKIVQQDRRFGVALPVEDKTQQIEVRRINGWTGQGYETMTLVLEPPYIAKNARIVMDFTSGLAAVLGESHALRREWRHALLLDSRSKKKIGQLRAPAGEYVAGVALDPKARFFLFVTRSLEDESLGTVSLYRLASRRWEQLHLNFQR